jgi:hypothetical protein
MTKKRTKSRRPDPFKDGPLCHECNLEAGAGVPRGGMMGITVWSDVCGGCRKQKTVIPASDYNWPKQGRKAIFD